MVLALPFEEFDTERINERRRLERVLRSRLEQLKREAEEHRIAFNDEAEEVEDVFGAQEEFIPYLEGEIAQMAASLPLVVTSRFIHPSPL